MKKTSIRNIEYKDQTIFPRKYDWNHLRDPKGIFKRDPKGISMRDPKGISMRDPKGIFMRAVDVSPKWA